MSNDELNRSKERARDIVRGAETTPEEVLALAKVLKNASVFELARELLATAREKAPIDARLRRKLAQEHALCTYKDADLPMKSKLEDALTILREGDDLETTVDQETLGLAGAIYKRMWELGTRRNHLEASLAYYYRGYQVGPATDYGYTSINAAYVLEILASSEEAEARKTRLVSAAAENRREEAKTIRQELVSTLPPLLEAEETKWLANEWWFYATVAEAFFSLGNYHDARKDGDEARKNYDQARKWIRDGKKAIPKLPDWEFESTGTQFVSLARLGADDSDDVSTCAAGDVLRELLGDNVEGIRSVFAGKLGIGLSGGGFRASLFHIGVLAKLAELDLLRHIHVLSCVSGGSILGAHYYLELRKLLQEKADSEITREDYERIVEKVSRDFLAGVQRNPRTRVAANPWVNLKMLFSSTYSRTERVGTLFEKDIYARVDDGEGDRDRYINDLYIHPKGEAEDFKPKRDNWRRRNKVPMLVLNATTLNTGHSWQFTASWMGESPAAIDRDVDGNARLRRMYYSEAPPAHRKIRLGVAVGASACVPGLFEPIALPNLYEDMTVRLVDGGVHDNQGIASLLEQDCTVFLVSDASGQMTTDPNSKGGVVAPLLRTNSVLMARVRQSQFQDLNARLDSSLIKGLMIVHLKKDLDVKAVDWIDCEDPQEGQDRGKPYTGYGLRKDMQELLAGIRTDLDSFSDAEAFALMTSGYRQTETYIRSVTGFPEPAPSNRKWRFLEIEKPLKEKAGCEDAHDRVKKILEVGSQRVFKIWRLDPVLKTLGILLGIVAVVGFAWAWWKYPSLALVRLTVSDVGWTAAGLLLAAGIGKILIQAVRYQQTAARVLIAVGVGIFGWLAARIHLWIFDPWFLRKGRLSKIFR